MTDMTPEELKEALELAEKDILTWDMTAGVLGKPRYEPPRIKYARALLYYLKPKPIAEADESKTWLGVDEDGDVAMMSCCLGEWNDYLHDRRFSPTHFYPLPPVPEPEGE